jgi:GTP-binding protein
MFLDKLELEVASGKGGNGAVSFRREKYVPKGGPDGGDGGRGGDVIIRVNPQFTTFADHNYKRHYFAQNGQAGMGNNKHGRNGQDMVIPVPPGTIVRKSENEDIIADLVNPGHEIVIAKGGRGGRGNSNFATSTNRAPRTAENGGNSIRFSIRMEVKLIADVGLVGEPNAGKSTLLATISAARPEVADYPFTTLRPFLGIVRFQDDKSFVMADIPGLIEGAHDGKGLGLQFLKHIERTRILAYVIDGGAKHPQKTLKMLQKELYSYSDRFKEKKTLLVMSKKDIWGDHTPKMKNDYISISAVTGEGLPLLKEKLWEIISEAKQQDES